MAWKQPKGGPPLYILDALLKSLAINSVSMKYFEIIVLLYFLLCKIPITAVLN
jgi:hypothetical protein